MNSAFVFLLMVFLHIVDDYYLQAIGPLASMKQREWWDKNYPKKMYKYDYLVALLIHSLSWAFMIMLPVAFYFSWDVRAEYLVLFVTNTLFHAFIDNAKANWLAINLMFDQSFHMLQIAGTFWIMLYVQ